MLDMTERQESRAALSVSEERLRLATDAAEGGFWDVDVVHDRLVWPLIIKAMLGISPETPISMADFYLGLHPDDREATSAAFAAACDPHQRALYDVEYRTVGKKDGLVRWIAAKGRGVFNEDRCVRAVGTAIDITERKRAREALRASKERLGFTRDGRRASGDERLARRRVGRGRTARALAGGIALRLCRRRSRQQSFHHK